MASTYLDLPPEMGGNQFGPFAGTVQIGTDAQRCQVVMHPQLGIADVHVVLNDAGDGRYMVAPAQKGFGLFLIRSGEQKLQPVAGATEARPGDMIILASPTGPRFRIRREEAQAPPPSARGGGGFGSGIAGGVAREVWRVQSAKLMMNNPLYRTWRTMSFRFRTGSLTSPRVLVAAAASIFALIAAGTASCGGILYQIFGS